MKKMGIAGLALVIVGALVFGAGYIGARGDLSVVNGNLGPFRVQLTDGHVHSGFFSDNDSSKGDSSQSGIGGGRGKPMTTPPPAPTPTPIRDVDTGSDTDSRSFEGEDVREIELNINYADVVILPSFDGKVTVSCDELNDYRISLDKNGVLSVESRDTYKLIGINLTGSRPELKVTLPKGQISSLKVDNSCGNISLEKHILGEVELETDMGDVYVHLTECLNAELSSSCGKVKAYHVDSSGELSAESDMGDVRVENSTAVGKLSAESSCGKVTVIDCSAADAEISSDMGDIKVSHLECMRSVKVDCDCGAISFTDLSAKVIEIDNSMGSIEGTLPGSISDYSIESGTDLGSNNLPSKLELGDIQLKVFDDCGSIDIKFFQDS